MQPVICGLQQAAMAKQQNRHAHVGGLSDAKKATRREKGRARQQRHVAKRKEQGLPLMSAAALAHKKALGRTALMAPSPAPLAW